MIKKIKMKSFKESFKETISDLISERNLDIITEKIIENKTYKELGKQYNITPVRVQQIVRSSIATIKPEAERFDFINKLNRLLKDFELIHISDLRLINSENSQAQLSPESLKKKVRLFNSLVSKEDKVNLIGDKFISIYPKDNLFKAIKAVIQLEGDQVHLLDLIKNIRTPGVNKEKAREFFSSFKKLTYIEGHIFYGTLKSQILQVIIKNFFPDGINFQNEDQFNRFVNYFKEFNDSKRLSHTKESYLSTIYKYPENLIKLSPFKYIHVDNDSINFSLIEKIGIELETDLKTMQEVDIARYYNKYKYSRDFQNVISPAHLYSRLKQEYSHKFNFYKEPRILPAVTKKTGIAYKKEIFENHIRAEGGKIERSRLKESLQEEYNWTARQICQHINNASNIIVEKIDNIKYVRLLN